MLSRLLETHFQTTQAIPIHPHYLVKQKFPIEPRLPSRAVLRTERVYNPADPNSLTTQSFAHHADMQVMHDFKEAACAMYETAWTDEGAQQKVAKLFEFPDGYNDYFSANPRFVIPEVFHQPQNLIQKEVSCYPSLLYLLFLPLCFSIILYLSHHQARLFQLLHLQKPFPSPT